LAPEILAGGSASAASDQFALAVAIFEFVDGRRPFDGTTAEKVAENYRKRMTSWQTVKPPGMTAPLWGALRRAFDADPAQRYSRCIDLARSASNALQTATPPKAKQAARKPALPGSAQDSTVSVAAAATQNLMTAQSDSVKGELPPASPQPQPLSLDRMLYGGRGKEPNDRNC
jgi:serine/threonine-protein kinase